MSRSDPRGAVVVEDDGPTAGTAVNASLITGLSEAFASRNVLGANGSTLQVTGYIVNDGNSGGNYCVTLHTASGTITARDLDINAASDSKVYDGTSSSAQTPTVGTLYNSDTVTGLAEKYDNRNAGTGKTLSVTSYTINDGNSGKFIRGSAHIIRGSAYR